jgi:hypothetical protein
LTETKCILCNKSSTFRVETGVFFYLCDNPECHTKLVNDKEGNEVGNLLKTFCDNEDSAFSLKGYKIHFENRSYFFPHDLRVLKSLHKKLQDIKNGTIEQKYRIKNIGK